jgi:hypothetical protein
MSPRISQLKIVVSIIVINMKNNLFKLTLLICGCLIFFSLSAIITPVDALTALYGRAYYIDPTGIVVGLQAKICITYGNGSGTYCKDTQVGPVDVFRSGYTPGTCQEVETCRGGDGDICSISTICTEGSSSTCTSTKNEAEIDSNKAGWFSFVGGDERCGSDGVTCGTGTPYFTLYGSGAPTTPGVPTGSNCRYKDVYDYKWIGNNQTYEHFLKWECENITPTPTLTPTSTPTPPITLTSTPTPTPTPTPTLTLTPTPTPPPLSCNLVTLNNSAPIIGITDKRTLTVAASGVAPLKYNWTITTNRTNLGSLSINNSNNFSTVWTPPSTLSTTPQTWTFTANVQDSTLKTAASQNCIASLSYAPSCTSTKVDVVLAIDRSGSLGDSSAMSTYLGKKKLKWELEAASAFVDLIATPSPSLLNNVRIGVVDWAALNTNVHSYALSNNWTGIKNYINKITFSSSDADTCIMCGVQKANSLLTSSTANRKIVILMSDGIANQTVLSSGNNTSQYNCIYPQPTICGRQKIGQLTKRVCGDTSPNGCCTIDDCLGDHCPDADTGVINLANSNKPNIEYYVIGYGSIPDSTSVPPITNATKSILETNLKQIASGADHYFYGGKPDNWDNIYAKIAPLICPQTQSAASLVK